MREFSGQNESLLTQLHPEIENADHLEILTRQCIQISSMNTEN